MTGASAGAAPAPSVRPSPLDVLLAAVWFGLAAGALESVAFALRPHAVNSQGATFDAHVFWMTPSAGALWLSALGLVLAAGARVAPRVVTARVATFVLAFVGMLSVLFLFAPELSRKASGVLAAGVAFQTSRVAASRWAGFVRVVRRTLPWMAAAVGAVAAALFGVAAFGESSVLRGLPAAAPDAPNVLLVVLDTVRADSLSLYGYPRATSQRLTEFAKTGVMFERAVTPAPWTLPSHASLFTGHPFHDVGVGPNTPLGDAYPTLAEVLQSHGYATAGFVANRTYCSAWTGLGRGFVHYDDFRLTTRRFLESPALVRYLARFPLRRFLPKEDESDRVGAADVREAFLGWQSRHGERPFFAFLNFFDAHDPYVPPPPFDTMFGEPPPSSDFSWALAPDTDIAGRDAEIARYQAQYDGSIAYLDAEVGRLLDDLRDRGVLEKTLVVVTSDHGEEFNEHGVCGHWGTLYLPVLHAPLVVALPSKVPAGRVVGEPVAVRDLGSTVLDLAGLASEDARFPGRSLAPHWTNAPPEAEPILSEQFEETKSPRWWPLASGALSSIVLGDWHFIHCDGDRTDELYRWREDPLEKRDLAGDPAHATELERCRAALREVGRR